MAFPMGKQHYQQVTLIIMVIIQPLSIKYITHLSLCGRFHSGLQNALSKVPASNQGLPVTSQGANTAHQTDSKSSFGIIFYHFALIDSCLFHSSSKWGLLKQGRCQSRALESWVPTSIASRSRTNPRYYLPVHCCVFTKWMTRSMHTIK